MNFYTTGAVAHLARVSRRQLHRWKRAGLIAFPPMLRVMTVRGKWACIYYWTRPDALPVIEFAKQWKNKKRAAARRMEPTIKKQRAELRGKMRAAETLLNVAKWFESHPLCSKIYTSWMNAQKALAAAGLLDADDKLLAGSIESLEAKLTELKTAYAALPGRHTGFLKSEKRRKT